VIIKNLSRKPGDSGQLVKYIFRYIFSKEELAEAKSKVYEKPLYVAGIYLSKTERKYLNAEIGDTKLLADVKAKSPEYNYKEYIQNHLLPNQAGKVAEPEKETKQAPFIVKHNVRSDTINGFTKEFKQNELGRTHKRSDQTNIHHTIISFSNKDSKLVSDLVLRDIAREYIHLRGEQNLYVGTVHRDREHVHLHIAMSGTRLDGKSARISKKDFEVVKIKLQEYQKQKYPQLAHSLPKHGRLKQKELDKGELQNIKRNERTSLKDAVLSSIGTIYKQAKSTEHFISQLRDNGFKEYYRSGRLTGIEHEQYKFRFSRLGVDLEALKQLDIQVNKEKLALQEIKELRQDSTRTKDIDRRFDELEQVKVSAEEKNIDEATEDLQELHDLRDGKDDELDIDDSRDNPSDDESEDDEEAEDSKDTEEETEHGGETESEGDDDIEY
jgi:hypothetical protein